MINIKNIKEPIPNSKLLREKDKLNDYIKKITNILSNSKDSEYHISRRYLLQPIQKLDPNWIETKKNQFNMKCGYCESPFSHTDINIDRFRPSSGIADYDLKESSLYYIWLGYTWDNLILSCPTCMRNKRNLFPVDGERSDVFGNIRNEVPIIINPILEEPDKHFEILSDGCVNGKTSRGKSTIDILQLNRVMLVEQRHKIYLQTMNQLKRIEECHDRLRLEELLRNLKTMISSKASFAAAARDCAKKWCSNNHENSGLSFGVESLLNQEIERLEYYNEYDIPKRPRELFSHEYLQSLSYDYIKKIHIENINDISFDHDFTFEKDITPCLMLLGENGTGKTTLLKAIALAISGNNKECLKYIDELLRANKDGYISVSTLSSISSYEIYFDEDRDSVIHKYNDVVLPVIAYGSIRIPKEIDSVSNLGKNVYIQNLIVDSSNDFFIEIDDNWIDNEEMINVFSDTILEILPIDEGRIVTLTKIESKLFVVFGESKIELKHLSSGYRSIITIVIDIMRHVYDKKQGRYANAIVLIDEIDAHLHPSWKILIVEKLRSIFPYFQFIFTCHDPLCLRGIRREEIELLYLNDNGIESTNNIPDPAGLKIDQLLTSNLFGLESTLDSEISTLLTLYYDNLRDINFAENNENEMKAIEKKLDQYNFKYLGYSNHERLMYRAIDEFIDSKSNIKESYDTVDEVTKLKLLEIWNDYVGTKND